MKKQITTLAELEEEQEKLEMLMEVTRQEFARNLGTNRKQLKDYFLKKVILPAGAVGLGVAAVNKMSAKKDGDNIKYIQAQQGINWKKILPLFLNIFQSFLLKKQEEELDEIEKQQTQTSTNNSLKSVA